MYKPNDSNLNKNVFLWRLLLHNMYMTCISLDVLFEIPVFLQCETSTTHLEWNTIVTMSWVKKHSNTVFRCGFYPDINIIILKETMNYRNFCKYILDFRFYDIIILFKLFLSLSKKRWITFHGGTLYLDKYIQMTFSCSVFPTSIQRS